MVGFDLSICVECIWSYSNTQMVTYLLTPEFVFVFDDAFFITDHHMTTCLTAFFIVQPNLVRWTNVQMRFRLWLDQRAVSQSKDPSPVVAAGLYLL